MKKNIFRADRGVRVEPIFGEIIEIFVEIFRVYIFGLNLKMLITNEILNPNLVIFNRKILAFKGNRLISGHMGNFS